MLQRFFENKARLWQRTFRGVDEEHHAVDHVQRAFDLATEVRVTGRVDDVQAHVAEQNPCVLREDRDAAFALLIHAVHRAIGDLFMRAESAALFEQRVDERGFAVVDVRDDRNVSEVSPGGGHWPLVTALFANRNR